MTTSKCRTYADRAIRDLGRLDDILVPLRIVLGFGDEREYVLYWAGDRHAVLDAEHAVPLSVNLTTGLPAHAGRRLP
jgi:hypothetical protein